MLCRKHIDRDAQPRDMNRIEMANHQALEELNDEINQIANLQGFDHDLEIIGPNHAQGNDPFEVGRRVQFELQRLREDTMETGADEDAPQDESLFSAMTTTEDTQDHMRASSGFSEAGQNESLSSPN